MYQRGYCYMVVFDRIVMFEPMQYFLPYSSIFPRHQFHIRRPLANTTKFISRPFKVSQEAVHVRYGQKKIDGSDWSFRPDWHPFVRLLYSPLFFSCFLSLRSGFYCPRSQVKRFGPVPVWFWLQVAALKRNSLFYCSASLDLLDRMERSIPWGEKRRRLNPIRVPFSLGWNKPIDAFLMQPVRSGLGSKGGKEWGRHWQEVGVFSCFFRFLAGRSSTKLTIGLIFILPSPSVFLFTRYRQGWHKSRLIRTFTFSLERRPTADFSPARPHQLRDWPCSLPSFSSTFDLLVLFLIYHLPTGREKE